MQHSFDIYIAEKIGLVESILLNNLKFWIDKNKANNKNFHNGFFWTYNSTSAFRDLFPYLGESQIKRALKSMEEDGYLITGNFNDTPYDRTKWYALTSKADDLFSKQTTALAKTSVPLAKTANGTEQNSRPIPDSKPYNKPGVCNSEIEKITPPENLPYPEMLKQNEGSGYFDRKPKIPTKVEVWEAFQRMGGTVEQAKAFWESNEATGWFYKGSPIVNFTTLANRFIANWRQIDQRNAKPKQNEPPKRKTQTAHDLLKERGLI